MAFKFQLLELDVSFCYYLVNRRKRPGFTFFDVIYKVEEENNKKLFFYNAKLVLPLLVNRCKFHSL